MGTVGGHGDIGSGTKPQRHNCASLLAAIMVGLALLSTPTAALAWSCAFEGEITAVALCQGDACTAGFKVEDELVPGTLCEPRPAVRALTDRERASFSQLIRHVEQKALAGIYQLHGDDICLSDRWRDERCLATVEITRLADANTQTLAQHQAEWEARTHRAAMIRSLSRAVPPILLVLSALAWPWILVLLKPGLKRHLLYLAIAALPLQILIAFPQQTMALIFGVDFASLPRISGDPNEGPHLGWYLRMLIIVVVPLQFGFILGQKFKPVIE